VEVSSEPLVMSRRQVFLEVDSGESANVWPGVGTILQRLSVSRSIFCCVRVLTNSQRRRRSTLASYSNPLWQF
jgi:hypothetical protein